MGTDKREYYSPAVAMTAFSRKADHTADPAYSTQEWLENIGADDTDAGRSTLQQKLVEQVGKAWSGLDSEPDDVRAVLIIAALHYLNVDWTSYIEHCNKVALGTVRKGLFDRQTRLAPVPNAKAMQQVERVIDDIARKHHYTSGILLSLLIKAKERGGAFPASTFVWLRVYNRGLWLLLNGHGRKSGIPETMAVVCHWRDELHMRRPLSEIFTDQMVEDLLNPPEITVKNSPLAADRSYTEESLFGLPYVHVPRTQND